MNPAEITARIKAKARELGFSGCGILRADPIEEFADKLEGRIRRFPGSRAFYEPLRPFAFPRGRAEWARSIIVCTLPYNHYCLPPDLDRYFGKMYLCDVRVPGSPEFQKIAIFESFLKEQGMQTFGGLISARWAAQKAGLGRFGRNNFLYTEKDGSWVWIQTWLIDRELACDESAEPECACPPGCRRCIDACPTGALCEPFCMDRGRCIAQLSYYSDELPSGSLRARLGTWLYGCDVCQNVCPLNTNKWPEAGTEYPGLSELAAFLQPEKILTMDEDFFRKNIQPRFWYIPPEKFWLWRCNAVRVMANSGGAPYADVLREACVDRDPRVREMAAWACGNFLENG